MSTYFNKYLQSYDVLISFIIISKNDAYLLCIYILHYVENNLI